MIGVASALAAGLCWGLVFIAPLWLSEYPPDILSFGRYLAFGIIAIPLALQGRQRLKLLTRGDWIEAFKLSLVGNIIYYCALAAAVQWAGAPSTSVLIGTLPVVIAICANVLAANSGKRSSKLSQSAELVATQSPPTAPHQPASVPWGKLTWPLLLILLGLGLVNKEEFVRVAQSTAGGARYVWGLAFGLIALIAWTWYPIRNSTWVKTNPKVSSSTWATVQGLATLPLAAIGFIASYFWHGSAYAWPFGPTALKFIGLMFLLGFAASWLGTVLWNRASQLLPSTLAGQLIVFETLAALTYAYIVRGQAPSLEAASGIAILVLGVIAAVRLFSNKDTKN
jgi:drug/metabolite transporter (DMT)-like permease